MIKIIIVDDNEIFKHALINYIKSTTNFIILNDASNGQELLVKLKEYTPDLILMDLNMPVLNGIDTALSVKKLYPDIKMIAISLNQEVRLKERLINAGFDGFLYKANIQKELEIAIDMVMKNKKYFKES